MRSAVLKGKKFCFSSWIKRNYGQVILNVVLMVLLLLCLFPFYIMVIDSFKTPNDYMNNTIGWPVEFYTNFYQFAWLSVRRYILNTLIVAVFEIFGSLALTSMAAYGFSRYNFKGKEALFMLILALMMIPGILSLIPQYAMINTFGLMGNFAGVILPTIASSLPFGIFLLRTFFSGIPSDLYEAAALDGASNLRRYFIIALPLSIPILCTMGLTSLMTAWNDLVWPRLVLLNAEELYTISVGIMELTNSYGNESLGMGVPLAAYVIVSIPLIVVFFFTSKQFISGLTSGAIKM